MSSCTRIRMGKGKVGVAGYYDATYVIMVIDKSDYTSFSKRIKDNGRKQIEAFLAMEEFGTKDKVADLLTEQLNTIKFELQQDTVQYPRYTRNVWGEEANEKTIVWLTNISSLLYLKRIKNDEANGWQIIEHNAITNVKDDGNEYCYRIKA